MNMAHQNFPTPNLTQYKWIPSKFHPIYMGPTKFNTIYVELIEI